MEFKIAVMGGDGIGPEVTDQGVRALEAVGSAFGHSFELSYGDIGGISIDKHGIPFTDEVREMSGTNDAVLFGAVGRPRSGTTPTPLCARNRGCWTSEPIWASSPTSAR